MKHNDILHDNSLGFRIVLFQIVMKLQGPKGDKGDKFQNCVILDSNETRKIGNIVMLQFQNCVILDSNESNKYI